ncbi:bacterial regulatory s, tetR family protein [Lysobacter antibioticus]|uniref:Bacterial regulatory, tetR family protein n=1 Tax=Lysobacter antibioticus TaxID=84531 RepID=A0A0S2FCG0_LYSAN|nr:TetR/AcrR family transcriptional regulator [Lysobacter antibioticus]ALN60979.1 bacterial regulatory s, tetR family protein [Lysobacter antibioticus]ALN81225.1 bacterial regulatory, tetR family protein [Lysobacter antibioticus]
MQQANPSRSPRSNRERTEATRHALLEAARALFVSKGYGDTSTPEVSVAAGTTRGALYHHFVDKRDLFRQVLQREAEAVRSDIVAAAPAGLGAYEALIAGSEAYLQAMAVPGRTRLLLLDGPAVLGLAEIAAIDESNAAETLHAGLAAAVGGDDVSIDALSKLLSAAFDRAALEIDAGGDPEAVKAAMLWLLQRALGKGDGKTARKRK